MRANTTQKMTSRATLIKIHTKVEMSNLLMPTSNTMEMSRLTNNCYLLVNQQLYYKNAMQVHIITLEQALQMIFVRTCSLLVMIGKHSEIHKQN